MTADRLTRFGAFVAALREATPVELSLDAATMRRVRAYIERVDRDEPGLGYEPGEPDEESLRVALGALVDRGLAEGAADAGLYADYLTGDLRERGPDRVRVRVRRAWRLLRRGY